MTDRSGITLLNKSTPLHEEGLSVIHETEDGAVHLWASRDEDGAWKARNWGTQLAGGWRFRTVGEADGYLLDSFRRMFPGHRCGGRCGAVEAAVQRRAAEEMNAWDYTEWEQTLMQRGADRACSSPES